MNNINLVCIPESLNIYFNSVDPQMEALIELHDNIMFYLVIVLFGVTWILISIIRNYIYTKSIISDKYFNHGTLRDIFWINLTWIFILFVSLFSSYISFCFFSEFEYSSNIVISHYDEELGLCVDNDTLFMDNSQTNHGRPWEISSTTSEVINGNKPIINLYCTKSTLNNEVASLSDYFYWSDANENTFNNLSYRTCRTGTMEVNGSIYQGVFRNCYLIGHGEDAGFMKFKATPERLSNYHNFDFRTGGEPVRFKQGYMLIKILPRW